MKFVFAGTTEFGIPTLEKLMADGHELLFVITQPDKPTGRKQEMGLSPIKLWANKRNIKVLQPEKIVEIGSQFNASEPDILLVAAYGQIVPKTILDIPKFGSVNIHGSLLPNYRGASPIQAALLNGDKTTGITLIKMDEKMDHGPIIAKKELAIDPADSFTTLYKKLSEISAQASSEILPKYVSGEIKPLEQEHEKATFTKLLTKSDGQINWTNTAQAVLNQIRALNPEPGTWTTLDGKILKILDATIINELKVELAGKLYRSNQGLAVKAQDQSILLLQVQPEGKKIMSGKDFLNGLKSLDRLHFI